jgi:galactoside O-acetyltransferase
MNSFYSKKELLDLGLKRCGEHVLISRNCSIYGADKMALGDNVRIDDFCVLSGKITLGSYIHIAVGTALFAGGYHIVCEDFTTISSRCAVYAESDYYDGTSLTNPMIPSEYRSTYGGDITVRRHSVIGTGTTVLPNVVIGEGCAVGAMSLVNKSLADWTICCGIPCRKIKDRSQKVLEYETQFIADLSKH